MDLIRSACYIIHTEKNNILLSFRNAREINLIPSKIPSATATIDSILIKFIMGSFMMVRRLSAKNTKCRCYRSLPPVQLRFKQRRNAWLYSNARSAPAVQFMRNAWSSYPAPLILLPPARGCFTSPDGGPIFLAKIGWMPYSSGNRLHARDDRLQIDQIHLMKTQKTTGCGRTGTLPVRFP